MTRKKITQFIRKTLTDTGFPPKRFICEVQTNALGGETLRQGDEWDGGLAPLSHAYRYAKQGDTVMVAVTSKGYNGELEDVIEIRIPSEKPQGRDRLETGRTNAKNVEGETTMAKKVGGNKGKGDGATAVADKPEDKTEEKKEPKRSAFEGKGEGEDGTHDVAVPEGFDFATHKPLGFKTFSSRHLHIAHRAAEHRFRANILTVKADELEAKAVRIEKLGDEKTRKKVKRAERVIKELGGLKDVLAAAGVSLADLLAEANVDLSTGEPETEG